MLDKIFSFQRETQSLSKSNPFDLPQYRNLMFLSDRFSLLIFLCKKRGVDCKVKTFTLRKWPLGNLKSRSFKREKKTSLYEKVPWYQSFGLILGASAPQSILKSVLLPRNHITSKR